MGLTLTGRDLVTQALRTGQVISSIETPSADQMTTGIYAFQEFVDSLLTQTFTILVVDRHVYNLVANQGGPDTPYTLGPGGDFDTGTLPRPSALENAGLVLNTLSPPVEIPLSMMTDDAFAYQPMKTLTNTQPTTIYYNPTNPLGTVILWPVPTTNVNQVALYYDLTTATTADPNTSYACPPGYAKMYRLGIAAALTDYFSIPLDRAQKLQRQANEALDLVKAGNVKMTDLWIDAAFTPNPHGTWNILTDQGGN